MSHNANLSVDVRVESLDNYRSSVKPFEDKTNESASKWKKIMTNYEENYKHGRTYLDDHSMDEDLKRASLDLKSI